MYKNYCLFSLEWYANATLIYDVIIQFYNWKTLFLNPNISSVTCLSGRPHFGHLYYMKKLIGWKRIFVVWSSKFAFSPLLKERRSIALMLAEYLFCFFFGQNSRIYAIDIVWNAKTRVESKVNSIKERAKKPQVVFVYYEIRVPSFGNGKKKVWQSLLLCSIVSVFGTRDQCAFT